MKEYYSPLPAEVTIGNDKVTIEVKSYEHGVQELIQMAIDAINHPSVSAKKLEDYK